MPPRGLPLLALALGVGLAACNAPSRRAAQADPAPVGGLAEPTDPSEPEAVAYYAVTARRAPLYYHSPAQPGGPDLGLPKGEEVELLKKERGYSRVRIRTGAQGYISNDQIAPLPPAPPPPLLPVAPVLPQGPTRLVMPSPDNPGRLQIVPLDQMINASEPPLPASDAGGPPVPTAPTDSPQPPTP